MNELLNPFLFQVIGSTPTSIRDSVIESGVKGKPEEGMGLATVCVFAAAVNKAVTENFLTKPELDFARRIIMQNFVVSGKLNMTGVTLLGHCLMTSPIMDSVDFVREFRLKMGQDSLWKGDFSKGSLSDKRKGILLEKKRVTDENQARLLGSGFFKFCGVDSAQWTKDEQAFWGVTMTDPGKGKQPSTFPRQQPQQNSPPSPAVDKKWPTFGSAPSPPRQKQQQAPQEEQEYYAVPLEDGKEARLLKVAVDYYLGQAGNTPESLATSATKRGPDEFNKIYGTIAVRGLDAAASMAGSVRGGT